jgi:glycolate oxidase iron-sulfur subunit
VLDPEINAAAVRLLNRFGVEVVFPMGEGCCGAIVHHMGRDDMGLALARNNVDVWAREMDAGARRHPGHRLGLRHLRSRITATRCGLDPAYAEKAARVAAISLDITNTWPSWSCRRRSAAVLTVAYHSACSMQHGQRINTLPKTLLDRAGFTVRDIPEGISAAARPAPTTSCSPKSPRAFATGR